MDSKYYLESNKLRNSENFSEKYLMRFDKDLEEIVKPLINDWIKLSEKEIEVLMKKFGNLARDEYSRLHEAIFSDKEIADVLLTIANNNPNNHLIIREVVSSIDSMYSRYKLIITDDIFDFLVSQTKNKKIAFYVSIFITNLPQFKQYKDKWAYIMSIPKIAPKNKSINTFYRVINENLEEMPGKDKAAAIDVFKNYLVSNTNLHSTTILKFEALIDRLSI